MKEVCDEVKMYQVNAMYVLLDLKQSYRLCWTMQMTRRCAQMLLKYESVAIIQLYETGMLEENEYLHILELIENKLFSLEYGRIQMPVNQKKTLEHSFDLIPYFASISPVEKNRWKSLMMSKHRWLQPDTVLLNRQQRVSIAYLIVRGIVQRIDDDAPTFYKSGTIVGIDGLFSKRSLSAGTYTVDGGLADVYLIDTELLGLLLSDPNISRSIYNEIALHMIMNNYKKSFNLKHSQVQMLINEKAVFYRNQANLKIHLNTHEKLFLLSGTMIQYLNNGDDEIIIDSIHLISVDSPTTYNLNSTSIVYMWTKEDEACCLNAKKFRIDFVDENNQFDVSEPFYPLYLGVTTEFSPRRHSCSIGHTVENLSNLRLIPSEIGIQVETETLETTKF